MYSAAIYEMNNHFSAESTDRTNDLFISYGHTRFPSRTSGRFGQNCKGAECKSAGTVLASAGVVFSEP